MSIALAGFLLGMSLIVAMGPQNILLIKQGIRREGITAVILVCLISDVILFTAGVLGVGVLTESFPLFLDILRWAGAVYLAWFALRSLRDALRPRSGGATVIEDSEPRERERPEVDGGAGGGGVALKTRERTLPRLQLPQLRTRRTWVKPMLAAVTLTWLNPGAYLDSLVMVGGIASQYGDMGRWLFIGGCLLASLVWFTGVGYGAGALSRPLSNPKVWRVLNLCFGVILVGLVVKLVTM